MSFEWMLLPENASEKSSKPMLLFLISLFGHNSINPLKSFHHLIQMDDQNTSLL